MSFNRTITEEDLDPETRKFVRELGNSAESHDVSIEGDAVEDQPGAQIDSFFSE